MDKVTKTTVSMPKKDFIKEHRKLAKLSIKKPKLIKKEAKDQARELRKVLRKHFK